MSLRLLRVVRWVGGGGGELLLCANVSVTVPCTCVSGRELTSDMIFRLAERFSNEDSVRRLGTHGLRVEEYIVDNKIAGELSLQLAAQAILKVWMYEHTDMSTAYTELCAILEGIGMGFFVPEILQKD